MTQHSFEWDEEKNLANFKEHGVSFGEAQFAFLDPHRIIAHDEKHSSRENDGFVWAKSRVAFWPYDLPTYTAPFEFLELEVGENGVSTMSRKTILPDKPIGKLTRVKDFLPPPSQLVPREETVKVTLALSKESVEFFKEKAKKNKVPYQRMIRSLVDQYVGQHT